MVTSTRCPRIRALLVDDSKMVRDIVRAQLKLYGTVDVVGEAADGREAIELVETLKPDLVVTDLEMPRMNGIEATRQIKQRPDPPLVVMLSFHDDEGHRAVAWQAGIDCFVSKMCLNEELRAFLTGAFPSAVPE